MNYDIVGSTGACNTPPNLTKLTYPEVKMAKSIICSVPDCGKSVHAKTYCIKHYQRFFNHGSPTGGRTPNGEQFKWIIEHYNYSSDECLIWPFPHRVRGYGATHVDGKTVYVSRHMCEQRNGPPPSPKHEAAHSCGRGHLGCVSPVHLDWKTSTENKADQLLHGTRQRGEKRPMSQLKETDVSPIRKEYAEGGISYGALGKKYGVSSWTIRAVVKRRTWAWLP